MLTSKCPTYGTVAEYGAEWLGKKYLCSCGATIELPEIPTPAKPPAVYKKQEPLKPSLDVAWGWTWRVYICLIILSAIAWFVWSFFAAINHWDQNLSDQGNRNAKPFRTP